MKNVLVILGIIGSVLVGCSGQEIKANRPSNVRWIDEGGTFKIYSFTKDNKEDLIIERGGGLAIIEHKTDTIGNKK